MARFGDEVKRMNSFKPVSLVDQITGVLSLAILEGKFKGGEQITELALQKQFEVSRSPVREALRDLEKKGLVEILPRKGAFVKKITRQDIEQVFPIRSVLEGLAARQASRRITKKECRQMEDAFRGMKLAASNRKASNFMMYHDAFHKTFIDASENTILIEILKKLQMVSIWFRFSHQFAVFFESQGEYFKNSIKLHENILNLFLSPKRNEEEIEYAVKKHIEDAVGYVLAFLESNLE